MAKNTDVAWAAGLFEGEGSIDFNSWKSPKKTYHYPRLQLATTDFDVIERFREIVGGHVEGPRNREGRKPIWYWKCTQTAECVRIGMLLRPWLGERRRERLDEVLNDYLNGGIE